MERLQNGSERIPISKDATLRNYETAVGSPHPLGAVPDGDGVNFSLYSSSATHVELLLFERHDDEMPVQIIVLDPHRNRTFAFWHVYVKGLIPGSYYAYRVDGPKWLKEEGHRFDVAKVLIDPYAKGNTNALWDRAAACRPGDNVSMSMRSVVIDVSDYDWEGDRPLKRPLDETIIYEMHVGGFTRHPSSGCRYPGTYSAIIEKIPYLQELGITAVELMPMFEFDDKEVLRLSQMDGNPLRDYWGYNTVGFFAPHSGYCVSPELGEHIREFRDLVKALHKAGIEVIIDVVFNHTSEGNHLGPLISFKGMDNATYYYLERYDKQYYSDYTGCGNTVNCNHPIVEKFVIDCLEFWVTEMHVDGFRFDEASILSRGEDGAPLRHPPVLWQIELNEILADTKIIAEAWDAAGLYQVGYFPGYRWSEWNGRYRDDIRRFVKGDAGLVGAVASRISGSSDLYSCDGRLPTNSINFITCHDGFTLNDLVSYNDKHNEANGEDNRDGNNDNMSWNCGVEGDTDDLVVEDLRRRQMKNFAAILMISQGTPMISAGDEVRRTQRGNNNAYCQDNEISWFDWTLGEKNSEIFRFFKKIIAFRKDHRTLHRKRYFIGAVNEHGVADISWHGTRVFEPGWNDPFARSLAFTLGGFGGDNDIHVMLNMYSEPLAFELPRLSGCAWHRVVDTSRSAPEDIVDKGSEMPWLEDHYTVPGHSVAIFLSK